MTPVTPQQRAQKALDWIDSQWAQYGRKQNEGVERLGSFSTFLNRQLERDRLFHTRGAHDALNPGAREMHLESLHQTEVREIAVRGMGEKLGADRFTTTFKYKPTNMGEINAAAEGFSINQFGTREPLESARLAQSLSAKPPLPKPAASAILMPARPPENTGRAATPDEQKHIRSIAEGAFDMIDTYRKRGLTREQMVEAFQKERIDINNDVASGAAGKTPDIIGSLRMAELGKWLAENHHTYDPRKAASKPEVQAILSGRLPGPGNLASQSGRFESQVAPAVPAAARPATLPSGPAIAAQARANQPSQPRL